MQVTSPPVIVRDTVVVGSSIDDNQRVREITGQGARLRRAHRRPQVELRPAGRTPGPASPAGAANVWAPMSADEARGLVFLPTSSASPDFYGAARAGAGGEANSVVALDAATGQRVWSFQTTHHDVWDYDVPAQPDPGNGGVWRAHDAGGDPGHQAGS
jgi:quinoprotein glucose dehydrogenase